MWCGVVWCGDCSEVSKQFPTLPFSLRALSATEEEERQAKLGVRECVQHELLTPYPGEHSIRPSHPLTLAPDYLRFFCSVIACHSASSDPSIRPCLSGCC